ncbi:hypothetical protein F2Q68_00011342 [Brassica cretica]|uniref:Uncharacterized protein n=1 Tax=Brassica cretica TaxID=69181 RepID=A0A8S9KXM1_BRACR|nr:hypothetical protein F2Q68_00011342 [Brassica cretica]
MRSTVIGFPPYHVFSSEKLEDTKQVCSVNSNEAGENEDVYQFLYYFRSSNAKQWLQVLR